MTESDPGLYGPIEPYAVDRLAVGDGQTLRVEQSGRPDGKPVVFLHGGPGGGSSPDQRRFFDPERYRIVCFDQRGCGQSTPHASDPDVDMSLNSTWRLVRDVDTIRTALGIESWQVFGGSWGSALALAYAETYPDQVTELILRGVFTLRRWELDWFYNGPAGRMAPEAWQVFCQPLLAAGWEPVEWLASELDRPAGHPARRDNIAAYHDLLWHPDPAVASAAGLAWTVWEAMTSALTVTPARIAQAGDPRQALAFSRIENHYFVNAAWLEEGQLIAQIDRVRHIPAVIVQGRYDLCCPPRTAWDLAQAWPEADLRLVLAGHSVFEPAIAAELVRATDRFAAGPL
ncbi:MAG: prolyl aminopeptidase [Propionibacteriaceae bacterium]|jgi:proline iminopeptidase|nr:prolyl aminopeptidase [Propionibacteriaceae bacterium]